MLTRQLVITGIFLASASISTNLIAQNETFNFALKPNEAQVFVESVERNLPIMAKNLVIHKSTYYALTRSEHVLGCVIKKVQSTASDSGEFHRLRMQFAGIFGLRFAPENYDCDMAPSSDIDTESCDEADSSERCSSVHGYRQAKEWILNRQEELDLLIAYLSENYPNSSNHSLQHLGEEIDTMLGSM